MGFTAIFQFLSSALNIFSKWWEDRKAKKDAQNAAVEQHQRSHMQDGIKSTDNQTSANAQNKALDELARQLDNPEEVVIILPGDKK